MISIKMETEEEYDHDDYEQDYNFHDFIDRFVDSYINALFVPRHREDLFTSVLNMPIDGSRSVITMFNTYPDIDYILNESFDEAPTVQKTDRIINVDSILYKDLKDKHDTTCSICLDNFEEESKITEVNECKHIFHKDCLVEWGKYNESVKCPICRKELKV